MTDPSPKPDASELQKRLTSTTTDMAALQEELHSLAQSHDTPEQQQTLQELNLNSMMELKLAVDGLRDMLWKYFDAVAAVDPGNVQEAMETSKLQRVTRLLELLRNRLGAEQGQQTLSFIERISASVTEKLARSGNKAA